MTIWSLMADEMLSPPGFCQDQEQSPEVPCLESLFRTTAANAHLSLSVFFTSPCLWSPKLEKGLAIVIFLSCCHSGF